MAHDFALITDSVEGLILTDVNTFSDLEPRNNDVERALTWNEGGVLNGAKHATIADYYVYVTADAGIVHVLYGTESGVTVNDDVIIHQGTPGDPGGDKAGDILGSSVAVGDFQLPFSANRCSSRMISPAFHFDGG